ncbi:MAG: hypothetical protein RLY30_1687 [Pseudomonadota bacterium]
MERDRSSWRVIAGTLILSLALAGCGSVPRPALDPLAGASGSGRFVLSGASLSRAVQGRYEWGQGPQHDWLVFADPWGNALGELVLTRPEGGSVRNWEIRNESGQALPRPEALAWLETHLGLRVQSVETDLPEFAQGLIQAGANARTIQLEGRLGTVSLRVIPDPKASPTP